MMVTMNKVMVKINMYLTNQQKNRFICVRCFRDRRILGETVFVFLVRTLEIYLLNTKSTGKMFVIISIILNVGLGDSLNPRAEENVD